MKFYDEKGKVYEATTKDAAINPESKTNKWQGENIKINNEEVTIYTCNNKNCKMYKHFIFGEKWYRLPNNMTTFLMPDQLYTKGDWNKLQR